jgi:hypothetical protein
MFVQAVGQMFNRLGVSKVLMDENLWMKTLRGIPCESMRSNMLRTMMWSLHDPRLFHITCDELVSHFDQKAVRAWNLTRLWRLSNSVEQGYNLLVRTGIGWYGRCRPLYSKPVKENRLAHQITHDYLSNVFAMNPSCHSFFCIQASSIRSVLPWHASISCADQDPSSVWRHLRIQASCRRSDFGELENVSWSRY